MLRWGGDVDKGGVVGSFNPSWLVGSGMEVAKPWRERKPSCYLISKHSMLTTWRI